MSSDFTEKEDEKKMTLVEQRTATDCAICAIAMALDLTYDSIMELVALIDSNIARRISDGVSGTPINVTFNILKQHGWQPIRSGYFDTTQRALVSCASLNTPGAMHMCFWDGTKLFDPTTKTKHTEATMQRGFGYVVYNLNDDLEGIGGLIRAERNRFQAGIA